MQVTVWGGVRSLALAYGSYRLLRFSFFAYKCIRRALILNPIPGPKASSFFLGMYNILRGTSPCSCELQWTQQYGKIVCYRSFGMNFRVLITDPEAMKYILVTNPRQFPKPQREITLVRRVAGEGLLVIEGDDHARQRRIISEAFHFEAINKIYPVFVSATEKLVKKWENLCATQGSGQPVMLDIKKEVSHLTLDVIGLAAFGFDFQSVEGGKSVVRDAFQDIMPMGGLSLRTILLRMFPILEYLPLPIIIQANKATKTLRGTVRRVVQERHSQIKAGVAFDDDLLSLMIKARAKAGQGLTEDELANNVQTFMLAGHETTSNALSWALFLLAKNPGFREKLRSELYLKLKGKSPTMRQLQDKEFPLLYATMKETLRLYPTAPLTVRITTKDEVLCGYNVPEGTTIVLSPFVLGRHPDLWERPDDFWPERWLGASSAKPESHPFHWMPFLSGSRQCIGRGFAEKEMMATLSTIIQHFDLDLDPQSPEVTAEWKITMYPSHLNMIVKKVNSPVLREMLV